MHRSLQSVVVVAALLAIAPLAGAQARTRSATATSGQTEFGMDGEITFGLDDPKTTTIAIPAQRVRVGFYSSDVLSWEPWLGLGYISGGGASSTALDLGMGLLWHLSADRAQTRWYVRPFVDLNHESFDAGNGSVSDTQVGFGVGFGAKVPLTDRIASRFEANLGHWGSSSNRPSQTALALLGGLSVFVH